MGALDHREGLLRALRREVCVAEVGSALERIAADLIRLEEDDGSDPQETIRCLTAILHTLTSELDGQVGLAHDDFSVDAPPGYVAQTALSMARLARLCVRLARALGEFASHMAGRAGDSADPAGVESGP